MGLVVQFKKKKGVQTIPETNMGINIGKTSLKSGISAVYVYNYIFIARIAKIIFYLGILLYY